MVTCVTKHSKVWRRLDGERSETHPMSLLDHDHRWYNSILLCFTTTSEATGEVHDLGCEAQIRINQIVRLYCRPRRYKGQGYRRKTPQYGSRSYPVRIDSIGMILLESKAVFKLSSTLQSGYPIQHSAHHGVTYTGSTCEDCYRKTFC